MKNCRVHPTHWLISAQVPTAAGLFADPARGAALMRRLEAAAWAAVEAQFLADDAWMAGVYGTPRPSDETLRRAVVAGLNAPPSQYQLHLQYLLPPLLPRQLQLYRAGNHFTKDRFLPLDWVLAALDALAAKGVAFDEDLDGAVYYSFPRAAPLPLLSEL